jgi:hypothetical protein
MADLISNLRALSYDFEQASGRKPYLIRGIFATAPAAAVQNQDRKFQMGREGKEGNE